MNQKSSKLAAVGFVFLVLTIGVGIGLLLAWHLGLWKSCELPKGPMEASARFVEKLDRLLELDARQREQIADIVQVDALTMFVMYQSVNNQVVRCKDSMKGRVRALLQQDQIPAYDQLMKTYRERHKKLWVDIGEQVERLVDLDTAPCMVGEVD